MQLHELVEIANEVKVYVSEKGKTLAISKGKMLKDYDTVIDENRASKIA